MGVQVYTALGVVGAAVLVVFLQHQTIATLKTEAELRTARMKVCEFRISILLRDKESDNEVDNLPSIDLRNVPDDWMRSRPH